MKTLNEKLDQIARELAGGGGHKGTLPGWLGTAVAAPHQACPGRALSGRDALTNNN